MRVSLKCYYIFNAIGIKAFLTHLKYTSFRNRIHLPVTSKHVSYGYFPVVLDLISKKASLTVLGNFVLFHINFHPPLMLYFTPVSF